MNRSVNWLTKHSDPSGPTFLTYTPNGRKLITAGSNNVVRVYTTGFDGEPTNIDDCQENNTAIATTVGYRAQSTAHEGCSRRYRMTFSLPVQRMVLFACTPWNRILSTKSLLAALYRSETLPFHQMGIGLR